MSFTVVKFVFEYVRHVPTQGLLVGRKRVYGIAEGS